MMAMRATFGLRATLHMECEGDFPMEIGVLA